MAFAKKNCNSFGKYQGLKQDKALSPSLQFVIDHKQYFIFITLVDFMYFLGFYFLF